MRVLNCEVDEKREPPKETPIIAKEGNFLWLFDGFRNVRLQWFNVGYGHFMLFKPGSTNRYIDVQVPYHEDALPLLKKDRPTYKFWEDSND